MSETKAQNKEKLLTDQEKGMLAGMKVNNKKLFEDEVLNSNDFRVFIKKAYEEIQSNSSNVENFSREAFIIQLYQRAFGKNSKEQTILNWVVKKNDKNILQKFLDRDDNDILTDDESALLSFIANDPAIKASIQSELVHMWINNDSFTKENLAKVNRATEHAWVLQLYQKLNFDAKTNIDWDIKSFEESNKDIAMSTLDEGYGKQWKSILEKYGISEDDNREYDNIVKKIMDSENWEESLSDKEKKFMLDFGKKLDNLPSNLKEEYLNQTKISHSPNELEVYRSCVYRAMDISDIKNPDAKDIENIYNDAVKFRIFESINNYSLSLLQSNKDLLSKMAQFVGTTEADLLNTPLSPLISVSLDFFGKNPEYKSKYKDVFDFFVSLKSMIATISGQDTVEDYINTILKYENKNSATKWMVDDVKKNAEDFWIPLDQNGFSKDLKEKYLNKTKETTLKLWQWETFGKFVGDIKSKLKWIQSLNNFDVSSLNTIKLWGSNWDHNKYITPEMEKSFLNNQEFEKCKTDDEKRWFMAEETIKKVLYMDFWYDPKLLKDVKFVKMDSMNEKDYQEFLFKMNYLNPSQKIKELRGYIKDEKILKYLKDKEDDLNKSREKYNFKERSHVSEAQKMEYKDDFFKKLDVLIKDPKEKLNESEKELIFECIETTSQNFEEIVKNGYSFNRLVFDKILKKIVDEKWDKNISSQKLKKIFNPWEQDENWNIIYDANWNPVIKPEKKEFFREFSKTIFNYGCKLYGVEKISQDMERNLKESNITDKDIQDIFRIHALDEWLKDKKKFDEKDRKKFYLKFVKSRLYKKLAQIREKITDNPDLKRRVDEISSKIRKIDENNVEEQKNSINTEIDVFAKELNISLSQEDISIEAFEKGLKAYENGINTKWSSESTCFEKTQVSHKEKEVVIQKAQELKKKESPEKEFKDYSNHFANVVLKKENPKDFAILKEKGIVTEQENYIAPVNVIYPNSVISTLPESKDILLPENISYHGDKLTYSYMLHWKEMKEEIQELNFESTNKEFLRRFLSKNWFNIDVFKWNPDEFKKNFWIDLTQRIEPKHLEKIIYIMTRYFINRIEKNFENCDKTQKPVLEKLKRNMILNPRIWLKQFLNFLDDDLAQKLEIYTNDVSKELNVWLEFREWENSNHMLELFFREKKKELADLKLPSRQ